MLVLVVWIHIALQLSDDGVFTMDMFLLIIIICTFEGAYMQEGTLIRMAEKFSSVCLHIVVQCYGLVVISVR